jgi:hypothetical protein
MMRDEASRYRMAGVGEIGAPVPPGGYVGIGIEQVLVPVIEISAR